MGLKRFKKFQYLNKYKTYKEALNASNEYFEHDTNHNINFIGPEDISEWERVGILSVIIAIIKDKNIRILDYGGGNRPIFSFIKATTNLLIKTDVIEKKEYCELIEKNIPKIYKDYLNYYSSVNELKSKKYDIICFNSSIQYLENYKDEILRLNRFDPKYILITKSCFQDEDEDYFTLETIVKDKYHPYIFFSYKNFLNFMDNNNYQLIFDDKYNRNRFKHDSISGDNFCHRDLLFEKK